MAINSTLKAAVIGDTGVRRTCLLKRIIVGVFDEGSQPTPGVEFSVNDFRTPQRSGSFQLWDTTGQEVFRSVTRGY